ncbi:hypothetical protein KAU11_04160 [Candidatus Babeliales bacterium]|nr:hypothetical protein [Candidatus Babeliales bacterium]
MKSQNTMSLGTEEESIRLNQINMALIKSPKSIELLMQRGILYLDVFKDEISAFDSFNKILGIDPKNAIALFWIAYTDYHLVGDEEKEKKLLNQALKINNRCAECYYLLAAILASDSSTSIKEIIKHYKKAIKFDPKLVFARVSLSRLLVRRFQFSKATKLLFESLKYIKKHIPGLKRDLVNDYYECLVSGQSSYDKSQILEMLEDIKKKQREFWLFVLVVSVAVLLIVGFSYIVF